MDYDDCVTKALQHETTATLQGCDDHQAALKLNDIPFVGRERDMAIIKESVDRFLRLNNSNSKGRRINNNGGDDDEDERDGEDGAWDSDRGPISEAPRCIVLPMPA